MRRRTDPLLVSRRGLLAAAGAAALCVTPSFAQKTAVRVVGVVRVNPKDVNEVFVEPFRRYMGELGWEEGGNIEFQIRWAGGSNERIPARR